MVDASERVRVTTLPGGSVLYETDRGAMQVTHLGSGFTSHVGAGHLTLPLAEVVTKDGEALLAEFDCCTFFVDCYDVHHLETPFREHMTTWFKQQRNRKIMGHMLVRSKVIELAAQVANLLSGTRFSKVYSSVQAWETACRKGVPDFRRAPLAWSRRPQARAQ